MGNLLGAPVTDKETHVGASTDGHVEFGVTSMQGWRVHMEDAHITEPRLYALDNDGEKLDLPEHLLMAVFDGHGGTFAAAYAGRNLCRVLSTQSTFVEYARLFQQQQMGAAPKDNDSSGGTNRSKESSRLLQRALQDAFCELDREIACAARTGKVEQADTPYHDDEQDQDTHGGAAAPMEGVTNDTSNITNNKPMQLDEEGDSGTTACVVLVTPTWIVCANAGDSRAVYSTSAQTVALSYDHKPDDEKEERRIRAAGGYVAGGRVEGDLAVSRGLGDFRFKQLDVVLQGNGYGEHNDGGAETSGAAAAGGGGNSGAGSSSSSGNSANSKLDPSDQKVSPVPDVLVQARDSHDEFVMIACDGIWDVMTNEEAVQQVAHLFAEGEHNLGLVCEEICDICLQKGSKDNMTALVIKFPGQKVGSVDGGGGVKVRRQQRQQETDKKSGGRSGGGSGGSASS